MAAGTETHSEEVPGVLGDTTVPARVPTATAVLLVWDREVEGFGAEVGAAGVAGAGEKVIVGQESLGALK